MQIKSKIKGIPCIIKVTYFYDQKGSYSFNSASDLDYKGHTEIEFEVLDRKGYPAKWLEKKLTDQERERIEQEIIGKINLKIEGLYLL